MPGKGSCANGSNADVTASSNVALKLTDLAEGTLGFPTCPTWW